MPNASFYLQLKCLRKSHDTIFTRPCTSGVLIGWRCVYSWNQPLLRMIQPRSQDVGCGGGCDPLREKHYSRTTAVVQLHINISGQSSHWALYFACFHGREIILDGSNGHLVSQSVFNRSLLKCFFFSFQGPDPGFATVTSLVSRA